MSEGKVKATERQILEILKDPQYTSEAQRAAALGLSPGGALNRRFRDLRQKYGIPEPAPCRRGRKAAPEKTADGKPPTLSLGDIGLYDTLTKGGCWYRVIKISDADFTVKRTGGAGQEIVVEKAEYASGRSGFKKRDLPPVTSYIDPDLKVGDIKVNGQPIKSLPDSVKEKITEGLKAQEAEKQLDEEAPIRSDASDFEPVDYVDPAWGVEQECIRCVDCRRKLADEEITYYEVRCEQCETKAMNTFAGEPLRRAYLDEIGKLLDILVPDCSEPEMAEQVKKLICYKLVIGFESEIGTVTI